MNTPVLVFAKSVGAVPECSTARHAVFEQQPMLRIQQPGLARRHAEKRRVEPGYVVDETGPAGDNFAGRVGIRVEELVGVPPVLGHLRYRVPAFGQHPPEFIGVRGAGKARRIANDRETGRRVPQTLDGRHAVVLSPSASEGPMVAGRPFSTTAVVFRTRSCLRQPSCSWPHTHRPLLGVPTPRDAVDILKHRIQIRAFRQSNGLQEGFRYRRR